MKKKLKLEFVEELVDEIIMCIDLLDMGRKEIISRAILWLEQEGIEVVGE